MMMLVRVILYSVMSFFTVYNSCRLAELIMNRERNRDPDLPVIFVLLSAVYMFVYTGIAHPIPYALT